MSNINNPELAEVFRNYPAHVREKMFFLRKLIIDTAYETGGVDRLDETLKWGEPAYLTKHGSTIRMDWKESSPQQYALYFHCRTRLVDTFREIYGDSLRFEGNRAIVLNVSDKIPVNDLKHCISLSLTYHLVKHLPMLGV